MLQKFLFFLGVLLCTQSSTRSQSIETFADSVRIKYQIPELGYAVVSADSIYELNVIGVQRANSNYVAKINDRFHLGSNTKAITSFIASLLVAEKVLKWDTKFFELLPELKEYSQPGYYSTTLQQLLTFRAKLQPYTYTFPVPKSVEARGSLHDQHIRLARHFLAQKPLTNPGNYYPTNSGYILAGLMLEAASGMDYKDLVNQVGTIYQSDFGFDYPNLTDSLQPWGHSFDLIASSPKPNKQLNWLQAAGNINVSLPDYAKFIQGQLKGLRGESEIFPTETFRKLLYSLPKFSFGWFQKKDLVSQRSIAYNEGDAGEFITYAEVIEKADRAYIIFTNSSNDNTRTAIPILLEKLKKKYGR